MCYDETVCHLFNELWDGTPIRLLGIRTSKLCDISEPIQLSLFDIMPLESSDATVRNKGFSNPANHRKKQEKLDKALDAIKNKYGKDAVVRGSLLPINKEKTKEEVK